MASLSWAALLKNTKVSLELLTDINMHLFVDSGIPNSIHMACQRYAEANNPYLKNHDRRKMNIYIMYFDANNLYGDAMSRPVPVGRFRWEEKLP